MTLLFVIFRCIQLPRGNHQYRMLFSVVKCEFSVVMQTCFSTFSPIPAVYSLVILSDKTFKILGKFLGRSCKMMHNSCRKMQDSCMKYQFLARILKGISGLMKFLQDMSGSWNIFTFL